MLAAAAPARGFPLALALLVPGQRKEETNAARGAVPGPATPVAPTDRRRLPAARARRCREGWHAGAKGGMQRSRLEEPPRQATPTSWEEDGVP